jgi:nicotinamidase-related amidase
MGIPGLAGRISALKSEGLLAFLQEKGIKSLVLCGVVSSGCVLSTARGGTDEGFVVTVASDACWDRTETKHKVVMEDIIPMVAYTAGLDEAVALLKGSATSK